VRGELPGLVRRASELTTEVAGLGADRVLPVLPELRELFAGQGLRRGSTVAVRPVPGISGSTSLLLCLLAAASQGGSWCAVVGLPQLGLVAAAEMGVSLERLALVPYPGPQWTGVVATLLDGFDIVVVAATGPVAASVRAQLAARARQRGSVLMPFVANPWEGADISLTPEKSDWSGLGWGKGRLRSRELTVCARGRGSAERPRRSTFWLPGPPVPPPEAPQRIRLSVVR
jgi:hypothetical protein